MRQLDGDHIFYSLFLRERELVLQLYVPQLDLIRIGDSVKPQISVKFYTGTKNYQTVQISDPGVLTVPGHLTSLYNHTPTSVVTT